jgi:hypothetical protein
MFKGFGNFYDHILFLQKALRNRNEKIKIRKDSIEVIWNLKVG